MRAPSPSARNSASPWSAARSLTAPARSGPGPQDCWSCCSPSRASRITRLTTDDITADGTGTTFLRLGDPPVCVPEPFAALLRQAAAGRQAAVIPAAGRWLFPGQNAGRPLHPATLSHLLTEYGIPVPAARTAAFRALVQQAPPPVIAQALGYSGTAAASNAAAAAGTWSRYAAGDHTR